MIKIYFPHSNMIIYFLFPKGLLFDLHTYEYTYFKHYEYFHSFKNIY